MPDIKVYCLSNRGDLHCPLSTDRRFLELTFNHQVRGEDIVELGIDPDFRCDMERRETCKNCPFRDL